eukprot:scaffold62451_cov28-Tisochrysis_lutea.AAC.7
MPMHGDGDAQHWGTGALGHGGAGSGRQLGRQTYRAESAGSAFTFIFVLSAASNWCGASSSPRAPPRFSIYLAACIRVLQGQTIPETPRT